MSASRGRFEKGFGLALALCEACSGSPPQLGGGQAERSRGVDSAVLASFSNECVGGESLRAELASQLALLQQTSRKLDLDLFLLRPEDVGAALQRQRSGFLLYIYSGHGKVEMDQSVGCYPPKAGESGELIFDDLARHLPSGVKGATFIINACASAYVDPRGPVPVSVISASPFVVATDSLFGHYLPDALEFAATDPNCDGLVTDRELFDALNGLLAQAPALSFRPAFPKLRRNSDSDIPLPIKARPNEACKKTQENMATLIRERASQWGELGRSLLRQLELARDPTLTLPQSAPDYFIVTGDGDATNRERVASFAREAGLQPLPDSALEHARALARFAIFTEIYELNSSCGFVRVSELRSGELLTTKRPDELAPALPRRVSLQNPELPTAGPLQRIVGTAPIDLKHPRPCYGNFGQCFEVPTER